MSCAISTQRSTVTYKQVHSAAQSEAGALSFRAISGVACRAFESTDSCVFCCVRTQLCASCTQCLNHPTEQDSVTLCMLHAEFSDLHYPY